MIVLGGGLAEAGRLLSDPLAERLQSRLAFREAPPLRPAVLGVRAGMLGAALLGWRAAGVPDAGATWPLDVHRSPLGWRKVLSRMSDGISRALSSAVEHSPYKRGVTGSNPVAPTRPKRPVSDHENGA